MHRSYSLDKLVNAFVKFKEIKPHLRLGTEIIVGFPTETEQEFQDSLKLIKNARFDGVDIYGFYEKEGTAATMLEPKVNEEAKNDRIKRIIEFCKQEKIHYEYGL